MTSQINEKVIILSSWAPPMIGGPVLLYNLLCQLPPEKYQIMTDSRMMATGIDPSTWLSGEYIFVDHPHLTKAEITASNLSARQSDKPAKLDLLHKIIRPVENVPVFHDCIRLVSNYKTIRYFINEFRNISRTSPTILLGISDSGPSLLATYYIARKYHIPYYLYLFDLYRGNCFPPIDRFIARIFERELLTHAEEVIVNNEGTVEHIQKLYGNKVKMEIIYNSVFSEKYPPKPTICTVQPPYEIIFTGNISWAQEGSLLNLLKAATLLSDLPLTISIYINRPPVTIIEEAARHPNVRLTYAPYSKMPEIQGRASLLFLPLAWDTKGPDIIETATPGKFTDYLAAGRPILIHAPDYAYVSKYAKKEKLGLVVDKNDVQYLANTIREFLLHPDQALTYVQNARRIFSQNHDARKNAKKLTEILKMV